MDNEILFDVKASLGPMIGDTDAFDGQLLAFINTTLLTLDQLGALQSGMNMVQPETIWADIIKSPPSNNDNAEPIYAAIQKFVCLKTRLLFDPPGSGAKEVFDSMCAELLWRIEVAYCEC